MTSRAFFLFIFRQSKDFWFIVSFVKTFFEKREGKGYFSFLIHFGLSLLPPPFLSLSLFIKFEREESRRAGETKRSMNDDEDDEFHFLSLN